MEKRGQFLVHLFALFCFYLVWVGAMLQKCGQIWRNWEVSPIGRGHDMKFPKS